MSKNGNKKRSNFEVEVSVLKQCKRLLDTLPDVSARGRVIAYLMQTDGPKSENQDELPFGDDA